MTAHDTTADDRARQEAGEAAALAMASQRGFR